MLAIWTCLLLQHGKTLSLFACPLRSSRISSTVLCSHHPRPLFCSRESRLPTWSYFYTCAASWLSLLSTVHSGMLHEVNSSRQLQALPWLMIWKLKHFSHLYIAALIATDAFEFPAMHCRLWDERPLGESFLPGGSHLILRNQWLGSHSLRAVTHSSDTGVNSIISCSKNSTCVAYAHV